MDVVKKANKENIRGPARIPVKRYDSGWLELQSMAKGTPYFVHLAKKKRAKDPPSDLGNLIKPKEGEEPPSIIVGASDESFKQFLPPMHPAKVAKC